MDTWISLEDTEYDGERNRVIYLLKSRGMSHSNQLREFRLTRHGIQLVDAYIGPAGVMTGSARIAQENREKQASEARERQTSRRIRGMERRRAAIARQIAELEASLADEEAEVAMLIDQDRQHEVSIGSARSAMATSRGVKS
jgi:circadian clock protein KaiC